MMNFSWLRNSSLGLALLVSSGAQAWALGNHGLFSTAYYAPFAETVYAVPTSYVVPTTYLSTSYVSPTAYIYPTASYLYPTSYVYPTTYTTSSYVLSPTSYVVPTYYRAASYVTRPVYSTALTYSPTTYYSPSAYYTPTVYTPSYYPTVLSTPLLASSTICNEGTTIMNAAPSPAPQPPRSPGAGSNERPPSSSVESEPENVPPNPNPPSGNERNQPAPAPAPAPPADTGSPPTPTAPAPEQAAPSPTSLNQPQGQATGENQPVVLPDKDRNPSTSPTFRQARKPVAPTAGRPTNRASNVLEGRVISGETRQGEEGVRVIVSNRPGNFDDRVATTDAFGHYAVRLPDGDWTVKVAMPSGRVYSVSQITISGGQIVDSYNRDVPSLIITR